MTHVPRRGRVLMVMSCLGDWPDGKLPFPLPAPIPLPDRTPGRLAADIDHARLVCFSVPAMTGRRSWAHAGRQGIVSDEAGRGEHGSFTGAFVGMMAIRHQRRRHAGQFDYFHYAGLIPETGTAGHTPAS